MRSVSWSISAPWVSSWREARRGVARADTAKEKSVKRATFILADSLGGR